MRNTADDITTKDPRVALVCDGVPPSLFKLRAPGTSTASVRAGGAARAQPHPGDRAAADGAHAHSALTDYKGGRDSLRRSVRSGQRRGTSPADPAPSPLCQQVRLWQCKLQATSILPTPRVPPDVG